MVMGTVNIPDCPSKFIPKKKTRYSSELGITKFPVFPFLKSNGIPQFTYGNKLYIGEFRHHLLSEIPI